MFESIVLGTIQGIAEWLPVSSEGIIVLVKTNFFESKTLIDTVEIALFLHLGTFLAALVYFRKDVWALVVSLFKYKTSLIETKAVLHFLVISTFISGIVIFGFLKIFDSSDAIILATGKTITIIIGIMLLITGILQLRSRKFGWRSSANLNYKDSIALGIMQGLAAIPGLSRSGLTVSSLLLRNFKESEAIRLSFLMSLPVVLGGNIVLNLQGFSWSLERFVALLFAFVFGLLTIDILLRVARKIQFAWFVLGFGVLMILTVFL